MRGRTLATWFRLRDPEEARRHVPALLEMDDDPIVRARFWDMEYDILPGPQPGTRAWRGFKEAVVAFPVRYNGLSADYPAYMYADDWVYITSGREVMGWPVRGGDVDIDPEPASGPLGGMRVSGTLRRDGHIVMEAQLDLTGEQVDVDDSVPPRWLATKIITDVRGPSAQIGQLVATGPERIHGRRLWQAEARVSFGESPSDELHFLAPREIVDAQYWSDVEITIGWGEVLAELGDGVWDHG